MKLKQYLLIISTGLFLSLANQAQAGRTGVSYYYGVGIGAVAPQEQTISNDVFTITADLDPTATGELIFGIEEDGWAFEWIGIQSLDGGTNNSAIDYSAEGTEIGLGYRSIEKSGRYYKIKYSQTDLDVDVDSFGTFETEGTSITIGLGFRSSRDSRFEIDYTFHDNDDTSDAIHFLSLRYLIGGTPYQGSDF